MSLNPALLTFSNLINSHISSAELPSPAYVSFWNDAQEESFVKSILTLLLQKSMGLSGDLCIEYIMALDTKKKLPEREKIDGFLISIFGMFFIMNIVF
jgi:hypothetical protein